MYATMSDAVKSRSNEFLPTINRADEVLTTPGTYRLYKQRWVGVFAMVCTTFFFLMRLHVDTYAMDSSCSRLWPQPVGHGLVPYLTTARLFSLVIAS